MGKKLQSLTDMAVASMVGTKPQTLSNMRTCGKKLEQAEKEAASKVKHAKGADKKEAKKELRNIKEVKGNLKMSKFLTMVGVGGSSFAETAVQNAKCAVSGRHDEIVDQNALQVFGSGKKERELPPEMADLASRIEKSFGDTGSGLSL